MVQGRRLLALAAVAALALPALRQRRRRPEPPAVDVEAWRARMRDAREALLRR